MLVILGIALTLVGVVLLVPIRYRLKTETTNGMKGLRTETKATWLLHLVSAYVTYQENELDWQVRVGWKKYRASEEDVEIGESVGEDKTSGEENSFSKEINSKGDVKEQATKKQSKKKATASEEKQNWIEKIKCTIKGICDKIKNVKDLMLEETHNL